MCPSNMKASVRPKIEDAQSDLEARYEEALAEIEDVRSQIDEFDDRDDYYDRDDDER